jgi:ATP-dependent DNA helicase RecG
MWWPLARDDTFSETIFKGPLHIMLKNALTHIKSMVIKEKVVKYPDRPEASRFFNYPFAAIEESLCNAVYHRSYEIREPIEVRILPDRVSILSFPGPDRSISDHDMREFHFLSRRYRNRRVGEFLKELDLTEGRGTGIPKILRALQDNGSPLPKLVTDNDRTYFLSEFPIHSAFTQHPTSEKIGILRDTSEKKFNPTLMLLKEKPALTISQLAEKLNLSSRAVEMQIRYLKKEGLLIRVGSRRKGRWKVSQGG